MKITCIDKDVRTVLESGFYEVPRFQRPYRWEREQVEEFWSDAIESKENDYFIGSMVLYKRRPSVFGIVDGQQRLTTITILLCALRDALQSIKEADAASGIHHLVERRNIDNEAVFVLKTETSYPYFQENIQRFGEPETEIDEHDEEVHLRQAADLLRLKIRSEQSSITLKSSSAERRHAKQREILVGIRDKVLALKLIFVELDNEDDAYIVFETMNTRGKDLSVADLIKNQVLRLCRPTNNHVDRTRDRWEAIVEQIEDSEVDIRVNSFLHHFWLSQYAYVTEKKLFKDVKARVRDKGAAQRFLEDLENSAGIYRAIHEPACRKWQKQESKMRRSLEAIQLFRVKQCAPMLLAVMRCYGLGHLKLSDAQEILENIENFHFVFTAITSQRSSGGISFMYALHARELLAANSPDSRRSTLRGLRKKLRDRMPSYQEFEAGFEDLRFTTGYTRQKSLVQYVLHRLHEFQCPAVAVSPDRMSIEHIAPQRPAAGKGPQLVGAIGNLLLVTPELNSKIGNKDLTTKKTHLKNAGFVLDDALEKATSWTDAEIGDRMTYLCKAAYEKVWTV